MAYVNADVILLSDFLEMGKLVASQCETFLVVGQRWDLEITDPIVFDKDWEKRLRNLIHEKGELHQPAGSDYFIFPRTQYLDMPDFAIGRAGWDNWMIYKALENKWCVVDATPSITVIHQDHDYSHLPGGLPHYDLEETKINAALGGGYFNMFMTLDSKYELINGLVKPAHWSRDRILRRLERWFQPKNYDDRGLRWRISRRFRRMRRGLI
jgi:hypothetical protein